MQFSDKDPYSEKPIAVVILGWVVGIILAIDFIWMVL
jgi:hypothetical protein